MKTPTQPHQQSSLPEPDALLEGIGDFVTTIPIDPVPPSENPKKNEIWIRKRAILTRTLYQNYPEHNKALSCVIEYWMLMTLQPHLFLKIRDELGDEPLEITNGYRTYDFRNRNEWEEWKQAYDRIMVQKLDEAHRLLANYLQHAIAYWAHEELI